MTAHHANIHPIGRERSQPFQFKQLHGTHGPWLINGLRLDELDSAEILLDSSTSTMHQTSTSTSTASNASAIGRAVVGGVALGGVGAVIGGTTGKRSTISTATAVESKAVELTVKLTFIGGEVLHAIVTDVAAYHWLLEFTTVAPATDEELATLARQATFQRNEQAIADRARQLLPKPAPKSVSEFWGTAAIAAVSVVIYVLLGSGSAFWIAVVLVVSSVAAACCLSAYNESAAASNDAAHAQNIEDLIGSFDRNGNPPPEAVEKIKNGTWRYEHHR